MLYLASQFVWFLLAAFGLGFAMGWISHDGGKARFWSGAWSVVAALWIAGAAATWFQLLNGMPATWVETALLFTGVYWVGCVCAGLLRRQPAAPVAVPQPVVEKLYAEIRKAVATPSVKERIMKDAGVPMDTALKDIEPLEKAEIAKWADVVKRAHIQVQ